MKDTRSTSYPNDTAIVVIKNPKNNSNFLKPVTKKYLFLSSHIDWYIDSNCVAAKIQKYFFYRYMIKLPENSSEGVVIKSYLKRITSLQREEKCF